MNVAQILRHKGSSEVATITSAETVGDAAAALAARRIGALVVSDDGAQVVGIVSERDIVRWLGREGPTSLRRPVADVMTTRVETCDPSEECAQIMSRMTKGRFRHLPVMNDGRLAGIISIGDVVKFRMSELELETAALSDMIKGY